jgi:hypothetical protein
VTVASPTPRAWARSLWASGPSVESSMSTRSLLHGQAAVEHGVRAVAGDTAAQRGLVRLDGC